MSAWALDPRFLHLNHGAYGGVLRSTLEEQGRLRAEMESEPSNWFTKLSSRVAVARTRAADMLGSDPSALAFVPNASAGATVALAAAPLTPGGRVICTDHGYGAVNQGVRRWAARAGVVVDEVHIPLGAGDSEVVERISVAIQPRTELVLVDAVTSSTARLFPVRDIGRVAHEAGVLLFVDGAHAPGLISHPVDDHGADVWIGNLHKFTCAPRGAGVVIARGAMRERLHPLIDSWGFDEHFPRNFDLQGTLDLTAWLVSTHAHEVIEREWGWERVRAHMDEVSTVGTELVAKELEANLDYEPRVDVGRPSVAMRLLRLPEGLVRNHPESMQLRQRISDELNAVCSVTVFDGRGYLRFSSHAYTSAEHYLDFAARLAPVLRRWVREHASCT